jgi:hypothetical protein
VQTGSSVGLVRVENMITYEYPEWRPKNDHTSREVREDTAIILTASVELL